MGRNKNGAKLVLRASFWLVTDPPTFKFQLSWGELAIGVNSPTELDHLLRRIHLVHLHLQIAWEAACIERELLVSGQRLGENDNWIAATARVSGMRLVTRDSAFARVRGLHLMRY